MLELGIPVPPAFVIGTSVCGQYFAGGRRLPAALTAELPAAVEWLEQGTGRTFGGGPQPLLVSVRSGAAISMPGMMDTILNLGFNDAVEEALAERTGDRAFAVNTRSRFVEHFAKTVGEPPSEQPWQQLSAAIAAVFDSWESPRAIDYRRDRNLPASGGTAVTVQAMVFGNLDRGSGTGVLFSRDPITGARQAYGEWLCQGQGEDVVSGHQTPVGLDVLAGDLPSVHRQLLEYARRLERDARDVQDIEFTVESGNLWLLQTRSAKRTARAALKIAVDLQEEGLISPSEALDLVTADQMEALTRQEFAASTGGAARILANGRPACAGVASGIIVTDAAQAERRAARGDDVILARPTTNPDDVHVMSLVAGVLTELGGATSHAAVVCRELGVPCIVGCGSGSLMHLQGQEATMDAAAGRVFHGRLQTRAVADGDADLERLREWARAESQAKPGLSLAEMLRQRRLMRTLAACSNKGPPPPP